MRDSDRREHELNQALEALHFAFRAVVARPDQLLARRGLSRVHHRILYFVGRNPGLQVSALLAILQISKQSLHAPLRQLVQARLLTVGTDPDDGRVRRLRLTARGADLEDRLSGDQRQRFARVFAEVGERKAAAWREVMQRLAQQDGTEGEEGAD